jgi:hypothetical protein
VRNFLAIAILLPVSLHAAPASAFTCDLSGYHPKPGLVASLVDGSLSIIWQGTVPGSQVRAVLVVKDGKPEIGLAARSAGQKWVTVVKDAAPEFRVVSGLRRMTNQQIAPLKALGKPVSDTVIERQKWEAFWDAPLLLGAQIYASGPPKDGIGHQPGLPRQPSEIVRSTASYSVQDCTVRTSGARLEVSFPGVDLAPFSGLLQYTFYKGANLVRQEVIAKTEQPSVAYKYDAGLSHVALDESSRAVWRDMTGAPLDNQFGGGVNSEPVPVQTQGRVLALEGHGSVAFFPPPHNFFWAREISTNLGYNWYRKDSSQFVSAGVRQAEGEADPGQAGRGKEDFRGNFALYSAPPGSWQRMAVYLLVEPKPGLATIQAARAFTRNDHYKALPGYQVMLAHLHAFFVRRFKEQGSRPDYNPTDFDVAKSAGVNVFAPIDGGAAGRGTPPAPDEYLNNLSIYYDLAIRHSDKDFSIMPNLEIVEGDLPGLVKAMGGHWDFQMPHPVYYAEGRQLNQPLVETLPKFGPVYRLGTADDVLEMMHREGIIAFMPHPRSKGSTGYPDAIKDTVRFRDPSFRGIGFRWGMGLDRSENRLCEERCLATLDDMNNWVADLPTPPKYLQAIAELYQQGPGDELYANAPVNYLHLPNLPEPGNWKPIVDTLRRGDFFVTSGEVLIPNYAITRHGNAATISANVQWTFPLEFVEIVWGDGTKIGRQIVLATDLPPFGAHHFELPFDLAGKKWVRFAVWDSAGDGALVQPVKIADLHD